MPPGGATGPAALMPDARAMPGTALLTPPVRTAPKGPS